MLDWPGRMATSLFLSGCGFACPYCHNPHLLSPVDEPADWAAFARHVTEKRPWLDGVVVTGGEPTDDPDLRPLLLALAEMGVPVKLDTNGSRPELVLQLISEGLLTAVAVDIKAAPSHYAAVTGWDGAADAVSETVAVVIASGIEHEFRTTAYPGAVTPADLEHIAHSLRGGRLYAIQQYRPVGSMAASCAKIEPYDDETLLDAAQACSRYLPCVVRGLSALETGAEQ
jgi:pyruvate formate lyase activating enzyme